MIHKFELTLAAVTLRIWLALMVFGLHWPFAPSYINVTGLCLTLNLLLAEWMVRRNAARAVTSL